MSDQLTIQEMQRQMTAAMQQYQTQIQQQQTQLSELNQRLVTLQHERTAAPSSTTGAHTPVTISGFPQRESGLNRLLPKPSEFHGEHGLQVLDWISELDIILVKNADPNLSQARKLGFALELLRSDALRWWSWRDQEVQKQDPNLPSSEKIKPITTWDEFKREISNYFGPHGASETARRELHKLRQSQFRSLADFRDRFEAVSRRIEVAAGSNINEELISAFKDGISDGQIRLHLTTAHPKTLYEAGILALQAEDDLHLAGLRQLHRCRRCVGHLLYLSDCRRANASDKLLKYDRYDGVVSLCMHE